MAALQPTAALVAALDLAALMRVALAEAEAAGAAGDPPIGAVLVIDGTLVARGRSRRNTARNQLHHAEMEVLAGGGEALFTRHDHAVLLTTMEPCPMCLGAVVMADVPHIVFASHDAVVHSAQTVATNPYVRRHIQTYLGGILETESRAVVGRYDPALLQYVVHGLPSDTGA